MLTHLKEYTNKRGEKITIVIQDGQNMPINILNGMRIYTDTGTCMVWRSDLERYVMDTDPKSDLQLDKTNTFAGYCNCEGKLEHSYGCIIICRNRAQAQDSLTDQINRVIAMAEKSGEYDAADWIKKVFNA